jgi:hypothetical protein
MMNISPPSNKKIFRWASFLLAFGLLNSLLARSVAAFTNPSLSILTRVPSTRYQPDMSLYFFRKDSKDGDDETKDADENDSNDSAEKSKNRLPFFGRLIKQMGPEDDVSTVSESTTTSTVVAPPKPLVKKTDDPVEIARALREQAERAKLEAERMDAALTLEKIEKLEKQLAKAKAKGSGNADNVSVEELQRQMDNLQAKLRGEAPKPVVIPKPESKKETEPSTAATSSADEKPKIELSNVQISFKKDDLMGNFDDIKKNVDLAPPFFQKLLATQVGYVYDSSEALNTTEIAVRLQQASVRDFSFSDKAKPEFSQEQIDREVQKIKNSDGDLLPVSDEMVRLADGNLTKLAIYGLEYNYYLSGDDLQQNLEEALNEDEFMDELKKAFNEAGIAEGLETIGSDSVISTLYPKCAYNEKEDDIPTAGQMSDFVSTVLTKTKFKATASPAKRLGGYIVRGTHNYENGDELIDAIDAAMQKSILKDKMTVLYTYDLFVDIINDEDLDQKIENFVDGEKETVLFVMAPNICREKKPVALSIVSAFGLASTWYLAVYPFLLNPTLAKRIEEQIELANSNMAFDLDFLTDMSVPLFYTFIGLQIIGEIAHSIVARQNGVSTIHRCLIWFSRPSYTKGIPWLYLCVCCLISHLHVYVNSPSFIQMGCLDSSKSLPRHLFPL